jgi:hypothetical protein
MLSLCYAAAPSPEKAGVDSSILSLGTTATSATEFLPHLQQPMPFPIRAIQIDGGSEFAASFKTACQQRGIRLFVLPPRSPALNGRVERASVPTPKNSMSAMTAPTAVMLHSFSFARFRFVLEAEGRLALQRRNCGNTAACAAKTDTGGRG